MKVLLFSGSPRKGNSEAIINRMKDILERKKVDNEIVLLREKKLERCDGCVEYCNKNLECNKEDDMPGILYKITNADGYVFVVPNYFKMPPAIFKNFIDRCSVLYTREYYTKKSDIRGKKAIVIVVGTDDVKEIDVCLKNIVDNFCKTVGIDVIAQRSFRSKSELKGNYNDIFENGLNVDVNKELENMIDALMIA